MEFIDKEIEQYAIDHTEQESELLKKINRYTHSSVLMPRMLSGHMQGRILSMLSKMIKPEKILEIGTYTGYSALCMAEGLSEHGKLITIDINEELESRVRGFFKESVYSSNIDYRIGNALQIIPTLSDSFDLVFIDADKENYLAYFNMIYDKLKPGAVVIADNVLWSGKVLEKEKTDKDTKALVEFNKVVSSDLRFESVLLPVRDGLMILRKKG